MDHEQARLGHWRRRLAAMAVPIAVMAASVLVPAPLTAAQQVPPATGTSPKVLGWGFDYPDAMARDGSVLFVANGGVPGGGSVTELATSTGTLVRVMAGSYYHFDEPSALAVYGGYLFVANADGASVSVIDIATGELAKYLSGAGYGFAHPDAMVVSGAHLWVLNGGPGYNKSPVPAGSVTELDASSGALVRVVSGRQYRFYDSHALAVAGGHLFVEGSTYLTELGLSTGKLVDVLRGPQGFATGTDLLAAVGADLFVQTYQGPLDELDGATGALVRALPPSKYGFVANAVAMTARGNKLFVVDASGSLNEINAVTGTVHLVLPKPGYGLAGAVAVALDGRRLFVASDDGWVAGVDLRAGSLAWRVTGSAYQFSGPEGMASYGNELFVASSANNRVVELDTTTGAITRAMSGPEYHFDNPTALAVVGNDLFVASAGHLAYSTIDAADYQVGSDLTELDATTGMLVKVLPDIGYDMYSPYGTAAYGPYLFLAHYYDNRVTEVDTSSGGVLRTLTGSGSVYERVTALAVVGNDLFVASSGPEPSNGQALPNGSIRELDARSGALVRVISGPAYRFYEPVAMAVDGNDIFVANVGGSAVTEVDASTGALVRVLSGPHFQFHGPDAVAVQGPDLYVASGYALLTPDRPASDGSSVTEVDAASGAVVAVLSGPQYQWDGPCDMAVTAAGLFVANEYGDSLTELPS